MYNPYDPKVILHPSCLAFIIDGVALIYPIRTILLRLVVDNNVPPHLVDDVCEAVSSHFRIGQGREIVTLAEFAHNVGFEFMARGHKVSMKSDLKSRMAS